MTTKQTKMYFRVFPDSDVIALWNDADDRHGYISSYQHVGQHGEASAALIHMLPKATESEKCLLRDELVCIGYDVVDAD